MPQYNDAYLFRKFVDQVVTDAADDPVRTEMEKVAAQNGLTVSFNKLGRSGGACVMPPDDEAQVTLVQGHDKKWRVFSAG